MGAEVVRLKSDDPARALLDFARTHGVSRMMVGRSLKPWWQQALFGSVLVTLLREATDLDLHIVANEDEPQ
jgi:two-component system sensor histidine kinase KdpD